MKDLLFIALILVCPLAMAWMRSGHGHEGASRHAGDDKPDESPQSELPTEALLRQRDELDQLLATREQAEGSRTPGER